MRENDLFFPKIISIKFIKNLCSGKFLIILLGLVILNSIFYSSEVFSEEYTVSIPLGAFNPELNTPAEVWYDPPEISVNLGDTITWTNDDKEGHTVTSGIGTGRFDWMDPNQGFGDPDGVFDSERFMPGESWSYTFEKQGNFSYFCVIHPWMGGIVLVQTSIPDYPHDASGNKLEEFPILSLTPDRSVEIVFSWDPKVIKTNEKVNFIYRFYDGINDLPIRKLQYDIRIIHNGDEVFRDEAAVSGAGGDYRQWIFEEPGDVIVKFENIQSFGSVGGLEIKLEESVGRLVDFSTLVYENPDVKQTTQKIVQPRETFQFYYEIAVMIIIVPAILLGVIILFMRRKKPIPPSLGKKSTPI